MDVFAQHAFDPPLGVAALERAARSYGFGFDCGIAWREGLLDSHGRRMLCRFDAPGAAALREALRRRGAAVQALWAGTIRTVSWPPPGPRAPPSAGGTPVLAERSFHGPAAPDELHALEAACAWCFEAHRVRLVGMLVSDDLDRIVYLCRAPDTESVRTALRQAGAGLDAVWSYRVVASTPAAGAAAL